MMNVHGVIILFIIGSIVDVHARSTYYMIKNGQTDSKPAFQDAWKKACGIPGGTMTIPKGTFIVSSANFEGPCNGPTRFILDGTLMAGGGSSGDYWITFYKVDGLTIAGSGTLNGNGISAWSNCKDNKNCQRRPTMLKIAFVANAQIQGIHLVNGKMFHLHVHESQNVNVTNVNVSAPEDSPNTDGIHISRSNYVNIVDSSIGTGDDCVSIGEGSKNVKVSGVYCGPGHGISIGSLGKYNYEGDVSGITVRNCTLTKTTNGLRIKTWAPSQSSIVVSSVTYSDIILNSVRNPILIDQYYCPSKSCGNNGESSVQIQGVTYEYVRGSSSLATGVDIQCSKSKPCQNIDLNGVKITYNGNPTTAICSSADVQFKGSGIPSRCS